MREYVDELVKVVKERREGVDFETLAAWEARAGRPLPEDVRTLYTALDGGEFPGEVKLLSFREVAAQLPEGLIVLGTRASVPETVLLMLTRADFERHSDSRPSWLTQIPQNGWMFALRKGENADLKPARTFLGLLERVIPPRETETFGEVTFARGLNAVAAALESLPEEVTDGSATPIGTSGSALVAVRKSPQLPPPPTQKAAKPSVKKPAAKPSAKKPAARKVSKPATKKPAAKKSAAKRGAVSKQAAKSAKVAKAKPVRAKKAAKANAKKKGAPKK